MEFLSIVINCKSKVKKACGNITKPYLTIKKSIFKKVK
jgi:hypothetical protein